MYRGVDFWVLVGMFVMVIFDGKVIKVGEIYGYGICIII